MDWAKKLKAIEEKQKVKDSRETAILKCISESASASKEILTAMKSYSHDDDSNLIKKADDTLTRKADLNMKLIEKLNKTEEEKQKMYQQIYDELDQK